MKSIKLSAALLLLLFSFFITACKQHQPNTPVSDEGIVSNIQSKINTIKALRDSDFKVTSRSGIVIISGNAKSEDDALNTIMIAAALRSVRDVDASYLTVNNIKLLQDNVIAAKVKGAFIRESLLANNSQNRIVMTIEVKNGVVTLSGNMDSQERIDNAISIAKSVPGVKDVQSKMTVSTLNNQ